jgi:aconitase A
MTDIVVDKVYWIMYKFRIEDLREAAKVAFSNHVAAGVYFMVVPGSGLVKKQAEDEGLDQIFINAGFGLERSCLMCLGMNKIDLGSEYGSGQYFYCVLEACKGVMGEPTVSSAMAAAKLKVAVCLSSIENFENLY